MSQWQDPAQIELRLHDLTCVRDDRVLFTQLQYNCCAGSVLQVLGFNGAGKTTLLHTLAGLMTPSSGTITWGGEAISGNRDYYRSMFYLGHQAPVKAALTVAENVQWLAQLRGQCPTSAALASALAQVDLEAYHDTSCGSLSAGQKRRVALAQLYLSDSPLWILDEPFTAIDKEGVGRLQQLLREHAERGGITILTSHQALALDDLNTLDLSEFQPDEAYAYV
ncbi:cytochrome c biogenesis heme-transporting ATPase CcmA [Gilvimarinus sp. DA14]|uniref:cytochrome c biogenesis heme-transporting ATPase CcmA n=1 Tax=Gilvimarinus sp. DA14 TaxID=2956798 RepID=UPI0020B847B5|nr:cytochrome c biogenesis heme-transporting ATPase CcmA [Gilvimarinus sp. DA14]UTF60698.1 cytochrome c biogenesis heme-transporting ATPase CcmA [Gilvimarinus sp. DA14]